MNIFFYIRKGFNDLDYKRKCVDNDETVAFFAGGQRVRFKPESFYRRGARIALDG